MTQRLTDDEIAKLREASKQAHHAPWYSGVDYTNEAKAQPCGSDGCVHDADGKPILEAQNSYGWTQDAWLCIDMRNAIDRLLDEIEERRRNDARRLADAEQALREECEAAAKSTSLWMERCIWKQAAKVEQLPSAIGVPMPKGKDGGA